MTLPIFAPLAALPRAAVGPRLLTVGLASLAVGLALRPALLVKRALVDLTPVDLALFELAGINLGPTAIKVAVGPATVGRLGIGARLRVLDHLAIKSRLSGLRPFELARFSLALFDLALFDLARCLALDLTFGLAIGTFLDSFGAGLAAPLLVSRLGHRRHRRAGQKQGDDCITHDYCLSRQARPRGDRRRFAPREMSRR